jgi:RNA polymerase sigma factor (sigma-70 family)
MFDRWKSDVDLLKASRDGSTQAFGVLVSRYQALVCAITYGATGDSGRSEELAQDAFLRAWKGLGQLQDLNKFRSWLCSIARNTVQNWFRSQGRDVVGHAASLDAAAETMSRESGPEEMVMFEEQQAVIKQALARMPEGLREPLILFYREGKSAREVAENLGLTEEAARQRIYRGRSLLREQVADMIENTIARTKPGKAFTAAVIASIVGLGLKGSATATAATAGSYGVASLFSGLTAKVAAVAVGAVVIAGGIVVYKQACDVREQTGRVLRIQPVDQEPSKPIASVPSVVGTDDAAKAAEGAAGGSQTVGVVASNHIRAAEGGSSVGKGTRFGVDDGGGDASAFEPRGVLSGRITDIETGEPVSGAQLMILSGHVYTAISDANGFYCIERIDAAGDYDVTVTCEEYVGISQGEDRLAVHLSPDAQIVRHFQLHKACMVDVWVVDANGAGIPDAVVVGTSLADDRMREVNRLLAARRTDPNGYLLLGGFAPADADYLITAWHTVAADAEGREGPPQADSECDYAPGRATIRLTDSNVIPQVQIVLERGAPAQARVEYADGVPAAGAEIEVTPAWWHSTYALPGYRAGEDGTFTLKHVVADLYDVWVRTPTSESGYMSRKVMQTQLPTADGGPLPVRLAEKSPQSLVSIGGTLVIRGQETPDSVRITMMSPSGAYIYLDVTRKPDGRLEDAFTIERLEPGTYSLTFSGDNIEETTVDNVVAPCSDLQVELVYVGWPSLAGKVVDAATGEPVKRFQVRVKKLQSLRGPLYVQSNQWVEYEDEAGSFRSDLVGPGLYQIQVAAEGYAPAWSDAINTDERKNVVVALSAGGAISGRILNESGEPVGGARIIPLSLACGNMPETENLFLGQEGAIDAVGGVFTLPHVPAGSETIRVVHPNYAPRIVEGISVAAGRTTEGVEVVLSAGGTIEGYVYNPQGKPLAGQVLHVMDAVGYMGTGDEEVGRRGRAVTDANGFYRIAHLPEELCYIQRMDRRQRAGVVCRTAMPRNGQTVRVDLGGAPAVRGRVVLDGAPLAGARLLIGPVRSPHSGAFTCYTMTDEHGAFTFGGARPGVYSVYRLQSGQRDQWLLLGTVTVGGNNTDVGVLPVDASSLSVTLHGTDVDGWKIESVFLTKKQRPGSTPTGVAEAPSTAGGPYRIKGIEPGVYTLNIKREDQVLWQTPVELEAGEGPWELSVDLPKWNAGVSGRIGSGGSRVLVVWREQKDVFAIVRTESDGSCRVRHLPAGRYFIGEISCLLYDVPPLAEVQVLEEQENPLELDLSVTAGEQMGFLLVQVVDENGWVCDDAGITLEGPLGPVGPVYSEDVGRGFLTAPGRHTLSVQAAGCRGVARTVNVKPFDPHVGRPQCLVICLNRK